MIYEVKPINQTERVYQSLLFNIKSRKWVIQYVLALLKNKIKI